MADRIIDWEKINRNLPYGRTPGELRRRRGLWRALDVNDNGFLSLAEVTRGVRDVLALEEIFRCRPAVNAAFHHCRDIHKVELPQLTVREINRSLYFTLEQQLSYFSAIFSNKNHHLSHVK